MASTSFHDTRPLVQVRRARLKSLQLSSWAPGPIADAEFEPLTLWSRLSYICRVQHQFSNVVWVQQTTYWFKSLDLNLSDQREHYHLWLLTERYSCQAYPTCQCFLSRHVQISLL